VYLSTGFLVNEIAYVIDFLFGTDMCGAELSRNGGQTTANVGFRDIKSVLVSTCQ